MKVDFSLPITGLDGKPVKEGDVDLTFAIVAASALLLNYPDEQNLPGKEKVERFKLAEKAYAGGSQSISVEEAALLKRLIAKAYAPLVVGRAYEIVDADAAGASS